MKRCGAWLLVAAILATSAPALAQGAGSAEAEELFKQGRAALERKDYATACTKLAESNRLERAVGTLISLAQCEEAQNKIAGARQHWQEAADLADAMQDRLQRGPGARQKVAELDKRVPRLTVRRAPNAPATTTVKRDDVLLTNASFDSPLPVDPGHHTLVVSAEGFEPRTIEITLNEGERQEIVVEPGAALPPPPAAPPPKEAGSTAPPPTSTTRIVAYGLGGLGVVGVGLGTIFGLSAASKWSSAQSECKPGACGPGTQAQEDKNAAASAGNISTIAFIAGGAALGAGVVLFVLSAPPSTTAKAAPNVALVPGPGGLSARGSF